jgi:F-type H+-transporting ATPase subunit b
MIITNAWAASTEAGQGETASGTTDAGHGAEAAHGGGVFPPFDPSTFASQLLWLAITFGLFYLLMSRVVIPRIASILEVRSDRISQDLDEANRLKEEAEAAHVAYEHELAQARGRAQAIAADAREQAKKEAEANQNRMEAELAAKLSQAETRIASVRSKAMADVGAIASSIAEEIVRQLVGGTVAKGDLENAISGVMKSGRGE